MDAAELIAGVGSGDRRALARAITHVEADTETGRAVLAGLYPRTGHARTVGVTGSAGVGKSTLVGRLARAQRELGRSVGIVAVDPSSPFSHGAILGDRIRMQDLTSDSGVFMRSMASRGNLAGYEVVIVETVGAGQDEVEIATATQTTVLITMPAGGDEVQSLKAGLMEVAQVMVVNKADLAGADTAATQLRALLAIAGERAWKPPILKAVARTGEGVGELVEAIDDHQEHLRGSAHAEEARRNLARAQVISLARAALHREALEAARRAGVLEELVDEVAARRRDPRSAAAALLRGVKDGWARERD